MEDLITDKLRICHVAAADGGLRGTATLAQQNSKNTYLFSIPISPLVRPRSFFFFSFFFLVPLNNVMVVGGATAYTCGAGWVRGKGQDDPSGHVRWVQRGKKKKKKGEGPTRACPQWPLDGWVGTVYLLERPSLGLIPFGSLLL